MTSTFGSSQNSDRRLFRQEIRFAIAHCNGLFRAGILTRLEAERLKNGLWTILKRADFDQHFFNAEPSLDVFAFVESRLFQLVSHHAAKIGVGRSRPFQARVALRLWLRDELETINETIENTIETLHSKSENTIYKSFAAALVRDQCNFDRLLPAISRMPRQIIDVSDETTAELDFNGTAHELNFQIAAEDSLDDFDDLDFSVEFASAAALAMLHAANFANAILRRDDLGFADRQQFEFVRAKISRQFGYHHALLSVLRNAAALESAADFNEVCELTFDAADTLKTALRIVYDYCKN